jgi:hypothetical protein
MVDDDLVVIGFIVVWIALCHLDDEIKKLKGELNDGKDN